MNFADIEKELGKPRTNMRLYRIRDRISVFATIETNLFAVVINDNGNTTDWRNPRYDKDIYAENDEQLRQTLMQRYGEFRQVYSFEKLCGKQMKSVYINNQAATRRYNQPDLYFIMTYENNLHYQHTW